MSSPKPWWCTSNHGDGLGFSLFRDGVPDHLSLMSMGKLLRLLEILSSFHGGSATRGDIVTCCSKRVPLRCRCRFALTMRPCGDDQSAAARKVRDARRRKRTLKSLDWTRPCQSYPFGSLSTTAERRRGYVGSTQGLPQDTVRLVVELLALVADRLIQRT